MAKGNNDITFSAGIEFDAGDLERTFGPAFDKLKADYQRQFADISTNIGGDKFYTGAATNKWNQLPFYQAHNSGGNAWATSAFMSGIDTELHNAGLRKNSALYQDAMLAASMQNLVKNPIDRFNMLRSYGLNGAASAAHPDSEIGHMLEQDYRLLSSPWAKDFVKDKTVVEPVMFTNSRGELQQRRHKNKATGKMEGVNKTTLGADVDFAGMRQYAVDNGLGRWINEDGGNTAQNFEFIDKEVEKINKHTNDTRKAAGGWLDELKGVLGMLTAIAGIGTKVFNDSINNTEKKADSLPDTRYFLDMSYMDILRTQKAGNVIGVGKDAIYNDISKMATSRSEFKNLGTGMEALFPSLLGVFGTINETTDPFIAYKKVAQALVDESINAKDNPERKQQLMMLMEKMGYSTLPSLVGSLADADDLGSTYGFNVEKLFDFGVDNPFRGSLGGTEALSATLKEYQDSIAASWSSLYKNFSESFGVPFLAWWDKFLQEALLLNDADRDGFDDKTGKAKGSVESTRIVTGAAKFVLENQSPSLYSNGSAVSTAISNVYNTDLIDTFDELTPDKKGKLVLNGKDVTTNSKKYAYLTGNKNISEDVRKAIKGIFGEFGAINNFENDKESSDVEAVESDILNTVYAMAVTASARPKGNQNFTTEEIALIENLMKAHGYVTNPYNGNPNNAEWAKMGGDKAADDARREYLSMHPSAGSELYGATIVVNADIKSVEQLIQELQNKGLVQNY